MKRLLIVITLVSLITALFGCAANKDSELNQTNFYYSRIDFTYGTSEAVVTAEHRDISGHADDLHYLLALYLMGPLDEELTSPFPGTTRLMSVELSEDMLTIELTDTKKQLTDAQFSLACACLTMTCMELTDASTASITSGERTVIMGIDDLLLYDDAIPTETALEETQ